MIYLAKGLLAAVAFLMSIIAYLLFKFTSFVPTEEEKPDEFEVAWSYISKAMAGVLAVMAIGGWFYVFAL